MYLQTIGPFRNRQGTCTHAEDGMK